jgi:hypothetical protein
LADLELSTLSSFWGPPPFTPIALVAISKKKEKSFAKILPNFWQKSLKMKKDSAKSLLSP